MAYLLSGYIYFHFFNMSETAKRIKILTETSEEGIKSSELFRRYTYQDIILNRLKRLLALGELRIAGDRYILGNRILLLPAKIVFGLRNIIFANNNTDWRPLSFLAITVVSLCLLNPFSIFFKWFFYPYHNELFGLFVAIVTLYSLRFLRQDNSFSNYLLICIPYLMCITRFLLLPLISTWDCAEFFFDMFTYIANAFAQGNFLPLWLPASGGIRTGFLHISDFLVLPHKIFGYYIYSILPVSAAFAIKLGQALGVMLMCFGWWLVLRKITHCRYASYFGALMILMGGTGITFHQEQALATAHLLPWFVLSLLKTKDEPVYIFPAVVLFGLGLSTHQPQIQLISMGSFILLAVLLKPAHAREIYQKQKSFTVLFLILLVMAALPSCYIFLNTSNLVSPFRTTGGDFYPRTYTDYIALNRQQASSALREYYYQYILQPFESDPAGGYLIDARSFFVGRIALVFALIGVLFRPRRSIPILLLLIWFAFLSLGVNSPIPVLKFFYFIHFPFINIFRQWYHFFPMVNFCLSAIAAIGFAAAVQYFQKKFKRASGMFIITILFIQILDLAIYDRKYFCISTADPEVHDSPTVYNLFARENTGPTELFQYKNRYELYSLCEEAIPQDAFLTTNIISQQGSVDDEIKETCELSHSGTSGAVVTNIPSSVLEVAFNKDKVFFSPAEVSVNFDGLLINASSPDKVLLVTPMNYDLGVRAYIDGKEGRVWRANGAMACVIVGKGSHRIKMIIQPDVYRPIALIHVLLYILVAVFFIFKYIESKYKLTETTA
jgi:hypothetical protein